MRLALPLVAAVFAALGPPTPWIGTAAATPLAEYHYAASPDLDGTLVLRIEFEFVETTRCTLGLAAAGRRDGPNSHLLLFSEQTYNGDTGYSFFGLHAPFDAHAVGLDFFPPTAGNGWGAGMQTTTDFSGTARLFVAGFDLASSPDGMLPMTVDLVCPTPAFHVGVQSGGREGFSFTFDSAGSGAGSSAHSSLLPLQGSMQVLDGYGARFNDPVLLKVRACLCLVANYIGAVTLEGPAGPNAWPIVGGINLEWAGAAGSYGVRLTHAGGGLTELVGGMLVGMHAVASISELG